MTDTVPAISAEELARRLDAEVAKYARQGYTVTDRTAAQVILQRKRKVSGLKVLVLVLLALTVIGLLLIPLALGILNRKTDTIVLSVDARGKVRVSK